MKIVSVVVARIAANPTMEWCDFFFSHAHISVTLCCSYLFYNVSAVANFLLFSTSFAHVSNIIYKSQRTMCAYCIASNWNIHFTTKRTLFFLSYIINKKNQVRKNFQISTLHHFALRRKIYFLSCVYTTHTCAIIAASVAVVIVVATFLLLLLLLLLFNTNLFFSSHSALFIWLFL